MLKLLQFTPPWKIRREFKRLWQQLFGVVQHNDIKRWGDEFLEGVRHARALALEHLADKVA